MKLNLSLKNKIFFVFIFVIVTAVTSIGWYGYKSTSEAYIEAAYELNKQSTQTVSTELEEELKHLPKDLLYNSNFYALKRYLIWESMSVDKKAQEWKRVFSDALIDFMKTQRDYYQARVLDLDGNEIISVFYNDENGKILLTPDSELQNKKGRGYAEVPKGLSKGEFYVSDLNLNIQNGKIHEPFIPVLRFATPMIDVNDELIGIFVLSIYAHNILDIVEEIAKQNEHKEISYYMVDKDGNYLYHKDKNKRWNKQLNNSSNFNLDYFLMSEYISDKDSGSFIHNNKTYSFEKVYPLEELYDNYWYIISSVDTKVALAKVDDFKQAFILILFLVIAMAYIIVRGYLSKIINPLNRVTEQLKFLSEGEIKKENIDYRANDEIGDLVRSTSKLIHAIEGTINQANAVANGDFTQEIELLGDNDALGLAIKDMTIRLKEIASLAQSLSLGNYDVQVVVKSSEDKLGLALVDMVKYLENITKIAESISVGDLEVKYKAKGEDDRLGRAILQMIKYLRTILSQAKAISKDDFSKSIEAKSINDELGIALSTMTNMLRENSIKNRDEIWFSHGVLEFSNIIGKISDTAVLKKEVITLSSRYVGVLSAVLYLYNRENRELSIESSFSYLTSKNLPAYFKLGDGVIGQVGLEKKSITLSNIDNSDYDIDSATSKSRPKEVYIFPIIFENELFGVAEMSTLSSFTEIHKEYLDRVFSIFATTLHSSGQNMKIKMLLDDSQKAFEELQVQSEELQESNVQMEEQQQQLTIQSEELIDKNTNLEEAKKEIDERALALEIASKYKSEFLANMSHELRTPLNSIILLSKLLSNNTNNKLDEASIKKVSVINKAGNELLFLINDILDLSKIESGNMELDLKDTTTDELLNDIHEMFIDLANEKKIDFIINNNFKSTFMTDSSKLSQVLKNLLSNAFKFTKEGSVVIDVSGNKKELIIEVQDSGIGIPSDKIETIFEAFKQVDGSISREFGGTGLGLSISKTIVELLGGKISVESVFGENTTFKIVLPLDKDINAKPLISKGIKILDKVEMTEEDDDVIIQTDILANKNILIVDDDSRNIFSLTSTLEDLQAEVFSAFNGREAIELLNNNTNIDLILMDIMMPIMDGLSAIQEIKADKKFKHIPIITLTAKSMQEDKQKCLDSGADDYLSKPINHNALISMIKAWIK